MQATWNEGRSIHIGMNGVEHQFIIGGEQDLSAEFFGIVADGII